jgi:hypothetical protein
MDTSQFQVISSSRDQNFRQMVSPLAEACWPEFMLHDSVADKYWGQLFERFSDYQFGLLDISTNQAIAMGNSVPLQWNNDFADLPERGWDWAFEKAVIDAENGASPNILCALQIEIHPEYQGKGLSLNLIQTMKSIGKSMGFNNLIAPVRPNLKCLYPLINIDRYLTWKSNEGSPFDTWIRVHSKVGAKIIKVCHQSMHIRGNCEEWESWTGLTFRESNQYIISGALNPVEINLETNEGIYVEPNVWVVHNIT